MKTLALLFFFCALAVVASAATWEVKQGGSGDFEKIKPALNAAAANDEILVWPGTYFEQGLVLDQNIKISSTAGEAETIIDGEGTFRCLHVTAGAVVEISGFTIQDGFAYDGAGIHVDQGAQTTVTQCTFQDNRATYTGGAGFVRESPSELTFDSCSFRDNFAPLNAGAVGVSVGSTCNYYNCFFTRNVSIYMAGAIANFDNSKMNIEGCIFFNNTGGECGAIRVMDSPAVIRNNTFFENNSGLGTVYLSTYLPVEFSNNIVAGETSGFGVYSARRLDSDCNIYYANIMGPTRGFSPSPRDYLDDPLFCNTEDNLFGLCGDSVGLPLNNNCGLIGGSESACGECGQVGIEDSSWGSVKALFR